MCIIFFLSLNDPGPYYVIRTLIIWIIIMQRHRSGHGVNISKVYAIAFLALWGKISTVDQSR